MPKTVRVGSAVFKTQAEAKAFIRTDVIAAYDGAARIPPGPIHDFVEDLINLHEDASAKIGVGIDHFRVDPAADWKVGVPMRPTNRTLVVVRTDGTSEDWGWKDIIEKPTAVTQIRTALRNAAYDTIQATKRSVFAAGPVVCARTGSVITNPDDAQIKYHAPTFARLTDDFAASIGGWGGIATTSTGAGAEVADPTVKSAWLAFYLANAVPTIERKY